MGNNENTLKIKSYINSRHHHPAWRLLAAREAPSILCCLQNLFEEKRESVAKEDAVLALATELHIQDQAENLDISDKDYIKAARKELSQWLKRGLIVERQQRVMATDALQKALMFVDGLTNTFMTSTASRLSTLQREIENVEASLNPNPASRVRHIEQKIKELKIELEAVKAGNFKVLKGDEAVEQIREVYNLSTSLRMDFRRVEDSYREVDKQLRQSIISEQQHRGTVVQELLDSHSDLLETPEGKVFSNFHQQLSRSIALDDMSERIKTILKHEATLKALNRQQQQELRWLKTHLVDESQSVIKARAASERDVKGFLKTGLAAEHHRVGQLLRELFKVAVDVNWSAQRTRRADSPIPPVAIAVPNVPAIERVRYKNIEEQTESILDLTPQEADLNDIEADFWEAFDSLDREGLIDDTFTYVQQQESPVSLGQLAQHFRPQHDLEALALWLNLAQEAGSHTIEKDIETFEFTNENGTTLRCHTPKVSLTEQDLSTVNLEEFDG